MWRCGLRGSSTAPAEAESWTEDFSEDFSTAALACLCPYCNMEVYEHAEILEGESSSTHVSVAAKLLGVWVLDFR